MWPYLDDNLVTSGPANKHFKGPEKRASPDQFPNGSIPPKWYILDCFPKISESFVAHFLFSLGSAWQNAVALGSGKLEGEHPNVYLDRYMVHR